MICELCQQLNGRLAYVLTEMLQNFKDRAKKLASTHGR